MNPPVSLSDMSRPDRYPLVHLENAELMPLPPPLEDPAKDHAFLPLSAQARERYECGLDDTCALSFPRPKSADEERELVARFLAGLDKLFSRENNWTFLQPLLMTMEHCARCQTCSDACHVFEASGNNELYRPTFRSEIMRRLYFKYVRRGGLLSAWQHGEIDSNWPLVARLAEFGVPLQSLPPVRPDLPHRRGQWPGGPRASQALQPGDGHRAQRAARKRLDAAVEGGLVYRHER
jgi:hypothetical protein